MDVNITRDQGFTLLELLMVMTITGVLLAVAIPQYSAYRQRAFDTRAKIDLRNVATAEEAYFIDSEAYRSCANVTCAALPGMARLSPGVLLAITATPTGFTGEASHPKGSKKTFKWDTSAGGFIE